MSVLINAVIIIIIVLAGLALLIFNNLIRLRNSVTRAWSNVEVLLEKRYDLITNLANAVKGYAQYEKTLLVSLTQLRSSWDKVKDTDDMKGKMDAANSTTTALKTLIARVENYPDLKADTTFLNLQNELAEIENEIADSRQFYNDSIKVYNINITIVPYDLFSRLLGYKPMPYFEAAEGEKAPINATFG